VKKSQQTTTKIMNEANTKFKRLFMKMLVQVETWQDTQQQAMDNLSTLIQECKHFHTMNIPSDNESNPTVTGVLSYFPHTIQRVQSSYIARLEQLQKEIMKYNQIQQSVCTSLNKLHAEAFSYYEQQKLNLNPWMDLHKENLHKGTSKFAKMYDEFNASKNDDVIVKHPFYVLSRYLHETQDIFVMFQKEFEDKKLVLDQVDYLKSSEELTRLYQLFSDYKYVNIDKVIEILETAEAQMSK
jgi:hypothetical protein